MLVLSRREGEGVCLVIDGDLVVQVKYLAKKGKDVLKLGIHADHKRVKIIRSELYELGDKRYE